MSILLVYLKEGMLRWHLNSYAYKEILRRFSVSLIFMKLSGKEKLMRILYHYRRNSTLYYFVLNFININCRKLHLFLKCTKPSAFQMREILRFTA